MKLYTVKLKDKGKVTEVAIPAGDFGMIQSLYSIFNIQVELVKEQEIKNEKRKDKDK